MTPHMQAHGRMGVYARTHKLYTCKTGPAETQRCTTPTRERPSRAPTSGAQAGAEPMATGEVPSCGEALADMLGDAVWWLLVSRRRPLHT